MKIRNLLISDYNDHCVHYVSREGGLIQIIMTWAQHGVELPYGIGVDKETGEAWIGSGGVKKIWYLNIYVNSKLKCVSTFLNTQTCILMNKRK